MPYEIRFASSAKRQLRAFGVGERAIDDPGVVTVLAIGTKRGNKLYIEGEEIEL